MIFVFVDTDGGQKSLNATELGYRGAWAGTSSYTRYDWAVYGGDNFVAVASGSNVVPTATYAGTNWSSLVQRSGNASASQINTQIYTGVWADPNTFVVPFDIYSAAEYYQDDNAVVNDWRWSPSSGTWFPVLTT